MAYLDKQGGTISFLYLLTSSNVDSLSVTLVARYISGSRNVVADQLSRKGQVIRGTEWSLHPHVAKEMFRVWGGLVVGFFTSFLNKKLSVYCSLLPDPLAW